jgi:hypothetical protein
LLAPDYPGFGQSEAPPPFRYRYTSDQSSRPGQREIQAALQYDYRTNIRLGRRGYAGTRPDLGHVGTL